MESVAAEETAMQRHRRMVRETGGRIVDIRLSRSECDTLDLLTEQLGINRRDLVARWIEDEREKQGIPKL